jgi:HAD superfamily hydrolase (TIGR01509 family)
MLQAVLFDMDGLMINTEPLQSKAYENILKEYGKSPIFYPTGVVQKVGVREKENWELIKQVHKLEEDTAVLIQKRGPVYLKILKENLRPQPGLLDLIHLIHFHHILMAVASSSAQEHIEMVLQGLGIRNYFKAIVSGQFVPRSKPYPDTFLEAAKKLQVNPKNCVILEDAEVGVIAGKEAGSKVIAIPNKFTIDQDMSKADLVVTSLKDIKWENLLI